MKKIKSFSILTGLGVLLLQSYLLMYGCSGPAGEPAATDASALYASKCSSCHRLLKPQEHSMEQWRLYVDKYGKKMTAPQKQIVLDYLQQRAADAPQSQQMLSH